MARVLCRRPCGRLAVELSVSGVGQACVWQCTRSTFIPCRVQGLPGLLIRPRAFHAHVSNREGFKLATVAPSDSIRPVPKWSEKASFGKELHLISSAIREKEKKSARQGTMSASQRRQAGAGASECMRAAASVRGTCGHRYI